MAISDLIWEAQTSLKEMKRKYKFKKARTEREQAVELQMSLAQCRGKLEICKKELDRAINEQSRNIAEGMKKGTDTVIQQQILWDAALGYMLVRDAIYAVETIGSYDAVSHAYEMLDAAMKQIAGKKSGFPRWKIGSTKERNAYGYITSSTALKDKEAILEGFFEELKTQGDIEARLAEMRLPGDRCAEQRHAYTVGGEAKSTPVSDIEERMNRLKDVPDDGDEEDYEMDMDSMFDIHHSKDSE